MCVAAKSGSESLLIDDGEKRTVPAPLLLGVELNKCLKYRVPYHVADLMG